MPKRKAITRISGLVDSDSDDDVVADPRVQLEHIDEQQQQQQRPTKKARGRPKAASSTHDKTEEQSTGPAAKRQRSSSAGTSTKQDTTKKPSARGRARGDDTNEHYDDEAGDALSDAGQGQVNTPEDTSSRAKKGRARKAGSSAKQVTDDGEFEYTPTGSRQLKPAEIQAKKRGALKTVVEEQVIPDSQVPLPGEDNAIPEEEEEETERIATRTSPQKSLVNGGQANQPRKRPTVKFADAEKPPSDPDLRRKLGEMTKKYETLESKYRTLREIGIVEANANVEKMKKQCDAVTNSSNKLIASLKEELAAQTARSKESRDLQKQLKEREDESNNLQSQVDDLTAELSTAQTEIKTLQTKLAAARNNVASAKTLNIEAPGSAVKNMTNRNAVANANTEAIQAAQLAQLKEDLYGDMTGLIIRSVKEREADHLYDCIQTGVNGTLQFKLAVAHERGSKTTASLDTAEFLYMPLLDAKRDAALINILPDYLTVDITFSRQNASKFYTRVMDSLTKRRIDPEE